MRTATRKILIAITALLAAVCLAFGAVMFVTTSDKNSLSENESVTAKGAMESYDKTYTLKDGASNKKTIWLSEVLANANQTSSTDPKKILVVLGEDWNLDDTSSGSANYLGASLTIGDGTNNYDITLDLNGKTLSRNLAAATATGRVITVSQNSALTLTDSAGGGKVTGGKMAGGGGGIMVNGTFTMNGGSIESNECSASGGGLNIYAGGVGVMNGGTIKGNTANDPASGGSDNGGGVQINGKFTMNGGTVSGNKSVGGSGGGVCASKFLLGEGKFIMNGGEISGNETLVMANGGGLAMQAGGEAIMNGGTISGNKDKCATAVYILASNNTNSAFVASKFTMNGGEIKNNLATTSSSGGVIFLNMGAANTFDMNGGTISGHTLTGNSGAVEIGGCGTMTMSGGIITKNKAKSGSAIYIKNGTLNLNGGLITGNESTDSLGVIGLNGPANSTVNIGGRVQLTGNTGGDLAFSSGYLTGSSGKKLNITGNIKGASIGILLTDTSAPTATGTTQGLRFTDKYNGGNGGAVGCAGGSTSNSVFFSNKSNYCIVDSNNAGTAFSWAEEGALHTAPIGNSTFTGTWKYKLSGASTFTTATGNYLDLNYGQTIDEVQFNGSPTYRSDTISHTFSTAIANHTDNYNLSGGSNKTVTGKLLVRKDGGAAIATGPSFAPLKDAGVYSFNMNGDWIYGYPLNSCFTIRIQKADIGITLNPTVQVPFGMNNTELDTYLKSDPSGPFWSVTSGTVAAGDSIELDFIREYGTQAGRQYFVTANPAAASATNSNANYNITVTGPMRLKIEKRVVTVILNDDYATYGDPAYNSTDPNNPTITESNVTATASVPQPLASRGIVTRTENTDFTNKAYIDESTGSEKTGTATHYYKGGWYYPSTAAAKDKFVEVADAGFVSGVPEFLEYTWGTALSATDYEANDADRYLNVRSKEAKAADATVYPNEYYEIKVKNTNTNYTVKFQNADGTAIGTDDNGTFQFEVRRAEQVGALKAINASGSPKVGKYDGATYDGTAKTIALPDITLLDIIKGYKAANPTTGTPTSYGPLAYSDTDGLASTGGASGWYKYLVYDKSKLIMSPATANLSDGETQCPTELEPFNGTPTAAEMATAVTYVKTNGAVTKTVKDKGTYVVYVVAEPTNHKPKVYKFEYKLDVSGTKYRIVVEQKKKSDNTVVSTLTLDASNNYATTGAKGNKVTYDPDLKVEARVIYEWQKEYTGAATETEPNDWGVTSTTDNKKSNVKLYYRGDDATLGTPAHSNAWGYGYLSTATGVDTNAVDDSGDKPVSGGGTTPRELGYSGAPSEAGKYVVSFLDINADSSNFNLVPESTGGEKIAFEIERKELKKPDSASVVSGSVNTYNGLEQTFEITAKEETLTGGGTYKYKMSWFKAGKVTSSAFDGSGIVTGLTAGTADDDKKEFKVTQAGKYKVALQLPLDNSYASDGTPNGTKPRNYKWESEATKDYIEVEVELKQQELRVSWQFLKDGSPSGATPSALQNSYKANVKGEISTKWRSASYQPVPTYDASGNVIKDGNNDDVLEEPVLVYYYKYISDTEDGTGSVTAGADGEHTISAGTAFKLEGLLYSGSHDAGYYVVGVKLSTATGDKAVNSNYKFDTTVADTSLSGSHYNQLGNYFKQIEITAGDADLNDIAILYQKGTDPEAEIEDDTEFVYSVNASGSAIGYKFNLNFDNIDYLDDSKIVVTYQEWDGTQYVDISPNPASLTKAGKKYRVKFGIEVKSTDGTHQLPEAGSTGYDTTATDAKFDDYERDSSDPKKGTLYYNVEIERAEVDLSKLVLQYQSGSAAWTNYDSTKPPKRTGLPYSVKVHPTADLPYGVTSASVDTGSYGPNQTEPGKVTFEIEFDLDDNYKYTVYQKDANGDLVLDGDNKPIVVTVYSAEDNTGTGVKYETYIQIAKEQLKIKWKYAPLKDPSGNDIIDSTTGQPFRYRTLDIDSKYNGVYVCVYTYAGDTQEYYGAAGLNQLRINNGIDSTNPQTINVEVRIVDNSGTPSAPQFQDQYEFASGSRTTTFQLGQKMYGVTVQVNHDAMEYSDAPVGAIYSLVPDADATTFDSSWCTVTLWKGTTNLGEYSAVDLATLDAGVYTVKFELIEAAQNTYLLSQDSFTFTVDQKELEAPELTANGVFNAKNQKLVDLLQVGKKSFNDAYKDLITEGILVLGGTYDSRNAGDYEATITITSDNYIWKKSASSTAKLLKVSLADEELPKAEIDSAKKVASYEWSIAPFVITSDMVQKSKENGLELNLPEWIAALTAGDVPTLGWEQNVYESASSNSKLNGAEGFAFESGKEYYISVSLNGEDAKNFIFQDSKTNISNKVEYQVAVSGFSAAMTKALDFLKANWWWLLIILGAILFLILLIVLIKKHKKNKEAREEKRRLEEEKREEKERKERERQEEKERRELEKQEEKERREQERREEKERREEEERRRREEEERRRREEEERRRNTPIPIPMPQMAATMQSQLQAQPQMQAQPQPQQAQPQPQPQAQPKQQPQKPKKRPMPENGMVRGFVPNGDGTYSPVNIRMKKRGMPDYPTPQMPMGYGMGMNPMGMQMPMMPQQPMYPQQGYAMPGMDNRPAEVRIAEEKARMLQEQMNKKMEADLRVAEERARANSGMSPEMMAFFMAAMQNRASAPAYQPQSQPAQQPAQPIFITGPQPVQQPQPILISPQAPAQQSIPQDGRPVVPPGAVMTTTSTTTIDATKGQTPNSVNVDGYPEYDDNYDYGVFERIDDKNN